MSESRHFEPSMVEKILQPLRPARDAEFDAAMAHQPDEAADFKGLADALDAFNATCSGIGFPDRLRHNAERIHDTTAALAAMAHAHAQPGDGAEPSVDKHAAKEFATAVDRWEDACADMASKLDL